MEAFGQDRVLTLNLTAWTGQGLLIFADLFFEDFIHVGGHFDLAQPLDLPFDYGQLFLQPFGLEGLGL